MRKRKVVIGIITVLGLLVPVLFLAKIIEAKIAFPIIFILLGCQQLYNGLFVVPKENKILRKTSLVLGVLFTIFGIFIVIPWYYL